MEQWSRLADAVDAAVATYRGPPPQPQEDAYWAVRNGALGGDEKRAFELALARKQAFDDELLARRQREHADTLLQIRRRTGTKWIRDMLQKGFDGGAHDCWGFVCFRTGGYSDGDGDGDGRAKERGSVEGSESAWEQFQKYYWQTAETVLLEWGSGDRLWPLFRTIVSDTALDGASTDTLRARFKAMVEAGEVRKGIRKDCFLIADEAAISSDETKRPYVSNTGTNNMALADLPAPTVFVHAVHADYPDIGPCLSYVPVPLPEPPSTGGEGGEGQGAAVIDPMAGFTGEVTLALPRVFDFLHYALCDPTSRLGGWEAIYHQTEVPARFASGFHPADAIPTYFAFNVFHTTTEDHPYRHRPQQ